MTSYIFHIDLDAFFVSVEQVLNPALKGKPVVVGGKLKRGVVASASYEARSFGLHSGMPLSTARRRCPQAIFIQGDFSRYRQASERFMAILADFTPSLEPLGLDEAYLDMTGFEYVSPQEAALEIKKRIKEDLDLTASVGIASCKVVAKIASDMSKPDGLLQVSPGEERGFLAPLPITRLPGVGKKTKQVLERMGITTIGQLADLPLSPLKQALGIVGETLHQYATGIDERKVEPPGEAKSISRQTTFEEDTLNSSFLRASLYQLSEEVGAELRQQGKQARRVNLKLRYADFKTVTRSHTLREATDADQVIFEAGLHLMESTLKRERRLVRLLGIGVSMLVSPEKQLNMFDSSTQRLNRLYKAIDRLRGKYGFDSIKRGQVLPLL